MNRISIYPILVIGIALGLITTNSYALVAPQNENQGIPQKIESLEQQINKLKEHDHSLNIKVVRSEFTTIPVDQAITVSVRCPSGTTLTGGGFIGEAEVIVFSSNANPSSQEWQISARLLPLAERTEQVAAEAECASITS